MPLYEFLCRLCGKRVENLQHHDAPNPTCATTTQCSVQPMNRLVSVPGVPVIAKGGTGAQKDG
jgi:putative FmdB family regulatory protein